MVSPYFLWAFGVGFAQTERTDRFTWGSRFLCWGVRCSFTVLLWHQRWLQLASTLCVLGGICKVALCVRLHNEPVQPRTWSVYGYCKATEIRQLYDCATCHPTNIFLLAYRSWFRTFFCFNGFISNIFFTYNSLFFSCMLIFCFISMVTVV